MLPERWLPLPGWPDYEASDQGRVRTSLPWRGVPLPRLIAQETEKDSGYLCVRLWNGSRQVHRRVHRLVLEAFVGQRPTGLITRHLNGQPFDNRLDNLRYGTYAENVSDQLEHGTHPSASRTSCPQGHDYTPENTRIVRCRTRSPFRLCKRCEADRRLAARLERAA